MPNLNLEAWPKDFINFFSLRDTDRNWATPNFKMNLFCNNKLTIHNSHNPVQHDNTKHIEVD